jgi:hypothetical protein
MAACPQSCSRYVSINTQACTRGSQGPQESNLALRPFWRRTAYPVADPYVIRKPPVRSFPGGGSRQTSQSYPGTFLMRLASRWHG